MRSKQNAVWAVAVIALVAAVAWAEPTNDPLKWSQPPDVVGVTGDGEGLVINGWDEPSTIPFSIVADDFECTSLDPVTDLHWWGSYPGLQPGTTPMHPAGFLIQFWTDVPAGADPLVPWSHPLDPIHEIVCRNYTVEHVGVDIDPFFWQEFGIPVPVDDAYQYNQRLDECEWFHQQGTPDDPQVYWVSIQAFYDQPDPANIWGWKTRPHWWNDDAARGFDDPFFPGDIFWEEIIGPAGNSWDMAFELTTIPEPATLALLAIGGGLAVLRRKRRKQ